MKRNKSVYLGFRATEEQAEKLSGLAEKAGVNTSQLLRLVVDDLQDVQPGGWSVVWAGRGKQGEAVQG